MIKPMAKRKEYSYDIDDPFDLPMILDDPRLLNARGRKAYKKYHKL